VTELKNKEKKLTTPERISFTMLNLHGLLLSTTFPPDPMYTIFE
jgi:hypothetical protein